MSGSVRIIYQLGGVIFRQTDSSCANCPLWKTKQLYLNELRKTIREAIGVPMSEPNEEYTRTSSIHVKVRVELRFTHERPHTLASDSFGN